ncbi:MAG: HIT family protein [Porticoccaceae bacterium]|nr:HIT family protein [Porticoccaceae bacterium]
MFQLHPQLEADTVLVGRFPLSLLLLSKDANYPWCILVPQRAAMEEIYQLDTVDQQQLLQESSCLAEILAEVFAADKINVATIGNMVPQLHMHHVARFKTDAAWPKPVWGAVEAIAYQEDMLAHRVERIAAALEPHGLIVG